MINEWELDSAVIGHYELEGKMLKMMDNGPSILPTGRLV